MVAATALRDQVSIERETTVADTKGGEVATWAEVYSIWAQVRNVRGREVEIEGAMRTIETYTITTHFAGLSITPRDRAVWNGKTLNITGSRDPDGQRRTLIIEAELGSGR